MGAFLHPSRTEIGATCSRMVVAAPTLESTHQSHLLDARQMQAAVVRGADRGHLGRLALDHDRPGSARRVALLVVIVLLIRCAADVHRRSRRRKPQRRRRGGPSPRRCVYRPDLVKRLPLLSTWRPTMPASASETLCGSVARTAARSASMDARRAALDPDAPAAAASALRGERPPVGGEAERRVDDDPVAGLHEPPRRRPSPSYVRRLTSSA